MTGGSAQVSYIHPDYLGSTNVVTDGTKAVVQALDYYPYGSIRVNAGTDQDAKKYIGQYYDDNSNLSYLNARYYDGDRGQFLSEDPVFWEVGQSQDGKAVLMNPQAQNSYSYAIGNPITLKDPTGRVVPLVAVAVADVALTVGIATVIFLTAETMAINLANGYRYGGQVQTIDFSNTNGFHTPNPLDPDPPKINPKAPKWKVGIILGTPIIGAIVEEVNAVKEKRDFAISVNNASNKSSGSNALSKIDPTTKQMIQKLKPFMTSQAQKALTKLGI